jgi:hypothetical protein
MNAIGLRLSRRALRVLRESGIFAQASVSLHYQNSANRYVVRGVESGGAAGDVGRYVTFARDDGQPIECRTQWNRSESMGHTQSSSHRHW